MQDLSPEPVRCHCARGMHKLGQTLQPLALGHPCSGQNAGWPGCQAGQVFLWGARAYGANGWVWVLGELVLG